MSIQWTKDGASKCGRFWTMKTRIGWRLYDKVAGGYQSFDSFRQCKEWACFAAGKGN